MKNITITDKSYTEWISQLSQRYKKSQIRAAVKVNSEMLKFYWSLGRDIVSIEAETRWGDRFMKNLSADLRSLMPDATCFSETNLKYMKYFYEMYNPYFENLNLRESNQKDKISPQVGDNLESPMYPQVGDKIIDDLFSIPWGHHKCLIDKLKHNPNVALFYIRKTIENGWSRSVLLNWIDANLYEREGKAISNFKTMLPDEMSDLAQEITRDPYDFAFTGITEHYNERKLKDALLHNIVDFLIELGTGFAYVGKEYRLQIGGYVVAVNHLLKRPEDNPTIGLLICKKKNATLARYALESSNQPIAISEYELERFYPQKIDGTVPTIAEIELALDRRINKKDDE